MAHPHARTWTLGTLDRTKAYRLWFDAAEFRWQVADEDGDGQPLTTRRAPEERAEAQRARGSGAGGGAAA